MYHVIYNVQDLSTSFLSMVSRQVAEHGRVGYNYGFLEEGSLEFGYISTAGLVII